VSLYYFSRAGPAASLRIYYEVMKARGSGAPHPSERLSPIPLGHSYFPKEIVVFPRRYDGCVVPVSAILDVSFHCSWYKIPNLVFESGHDSGGHFAAHEKPKELVGDLRKMFGKGGTAFGVVKGSNGYAN
jgi:hypothetical protein